MTSDTDNLRVQALGSQVLGSSSSTQQQQQQHERTSSMQQGSHQTQPSLAMQHQQSSAQPQTDQLHSNYSNPQGHIPHRSHAQQDLVPSDRSTSSGLMRSSSQRRADSTVGDSIVQTVTRQNSIPGPSGEPIELTETISIETTVVDEHGQPVPEEYRAEALRMLQASSDAAGDSLQRLSSDHGMHTSYDTAGHSLQGMSSGQDRGGMQSVGSYLAGTGTERASISTEDFQGGINLQNAASGAAGSSSEGFSDMRGGSTQQAAYRTAGLGMGMLSQEEASHHSPAPSQTQREDAPAASAAHQLPEAASATHQSPAIHETSRDRSHGSQLRSDPLVGDSMVQVSSRQGTETSPEGQAVDITETVSIETTVVDEFGNPAGPEQQAAARQMLLDASNAAGESLQSGTSATHGNHTWSSSGAEAQHPPHAAGESLQSGSSASHGNHTLSSLGAEAQRSYPVAGESLQTVSSSRNADHRLTSSGAEAHQSFQPSQQASHEADDFDGSHLQADSHASLMPRSTPSGAHLGLNVPSASSTTDDATRTGISHDMPAGAVRGSNGQQQHYPQELQEAQHSEASFKGTGSQSVVPTGGSLREGHSLPEGHTRDSSSNPHMGAGSWPSDPTHAVPSGDHFGNFGDFSGMPVGPMHATSQEGHFGDFSSMQDASRPTAPDANSRSADPGSLSEPSTGAIPHNEDSGDFSGMQHAPMETASHGEIRVAESGSKSMDQERAIPHHDDFGDFGGMQHAPMETASPANIRAADSGSQSMDQEQAIPHNEGFGDFSGMQDAPMQAASPANIRAADSGSQSMDLEQAAPQGDHFGSFSGMRDASMMTASPADIKAAETGGVGEGVAAHHGAASAMHGQNHSLDHMPSASPRATRTQSAAASEFLQNQVAGGDMPQGGGVPVSASASESVSVSSKVQSARDSPAKSFANSFETSQAQLEQNADVSGMTNAARTDAVHANGHDTSTLPQHDDPSRQASHATKGPQAVSNFGGRPEHSNSSAGVQSSIEAAEMGSQRGQRAEVGEAGDLGPFANPLPQKQTPQAQTDHADADADASDAFEAFERPVEAVSLPQKEQQSASSRSVHQKAQSHPSAADDEFGDFDALPTGGHAAHIGTDLAAADDEFGDCDALPTGGRAAHIGTDLAAADDEFGEFDALPADGRAAQNGTDFAAADDEFGKFDTLPAGGLAAQNGTDLAAADDEFGDFDALPARSAQQGTPELYTAAQRGSTSQEDGFAAFKDFAAGSHAETAASMRNLDENSTDLKAGHADRHPDDTGFGAFNHTEQSHSEQHESQSASNPDTQDSGAFPQSAKSKPIQEEDSFGSFDRPRDTSADAQSGGKPFVQQATASAQGAEPTDGRAAALPDAVDDDDEDAFGDFDEPQSGLSSPKSSPAFMLFLCVKLSSLGR